MQTRRLSLLVAGLALAVAVWPGTASAQSSNVIAPWDGENPFVCETQDVGTGTDFPDPDADPFCVEFDKTQQNLTDFGLAEFLVQEPARVTAAGPKCFYHQTDHWTGSVVQGSEPELWHWDGRYFFDKAKGIGGVHVKNFRIGGVPADFTPFVPAAYQGYVEPTGGGGVIYQFESNPDPNCAARIDTPEEREEIYRGEPREKDCIKPGGQVRAGRIGRVRLGISRDEVWKRLGEPRRTKRYSHHWCVVGGSRISVTYHRVPPRTASASRRGQDESRGVSLVRTTNPGHNVRRVGAGTRRARALERLRLRRARSFRLGRTRAYLRDLGPNVLVVGIRARRVRWLALADPRRLPTSGRIATSLRHAR